LPIVGTAEVDTVPMPLPPVAEALIREADSLACQSWNEKMWSDGGPIDPSPTIDQAINGGFP
jgi:hypothetical protein